MIDPPLTAPQSDTYNSGLVCSLTTHLKSQVKITIIYKLNDTRNSHLDPVYGINKLWFVWDLFVCLFLLFWVLGVVVLAFFVGG